MAAPNIVGVSSIYGESKGYALTTTTSTTLLTCPAEKVIKVNSIIVSNVDGSNAADAQIYFYDNSQATAYALAYNVTVPAKSTLVVLSKDAGIYLEESDTIRGGASANSDLHCVISWDILDAA